MGGNGRDSKQKTQIIEVDVSNEHIHSYAIRFLNCSLHVCARFLFFVRCSELFL